MQFLWHQLGDFLVVVALFAVFCLIASFKLWPQWLRKLTSSSWPTTLGTIEDGEVSVLHSFDRGVAREVATCSLNYSYQVKGEYYGGVHSKQFFDEQAAYDYIGSLKGKATQIKYNPREPGTSVLITSS